MRWSLPYLGWSANGWFMIQIHLLRYKTYRGDNPQMLTQTHIIEWYHPKEERRNKKKHHKIAGLNISNYKKHIQLDISKPFNPWGPKGLKNLPKQHLSSVEVYTAPQFFFAKKKNGVCLFVGILFFAIFLGLVKKFKNSHRRFLPKNPSRTPRLKVLRTQLTCCLRCFSHPGCAAQL